MKFCSKCDKEKNENEFGKDKYKKDGLSVYCRQCLKNRNAEQRKNNPEKIKEWALAYRMRDREKIKEWHKKHYQVNKEKILKECRENYYENKEIIAIRRKKQRSRITDKQKNALRQKEWRQKNPEKFRAYVRRWQKIHSEKHNAHQRVHRAVEDGVLKRPEYCESCRKKCKPEGHHEDYSRPLEVIWLCRVCHAKKIEKVIIKN